MRKILITALITLCYTTVFTQESASNIRLNQIGFLPYAEKIAAITDVSASKFEIIDTFGTKVFEVLFQNHRFGVRQVKQLKLQISVFLQHQEFITFKFPDMGNRFVSKFLTRYFLK